MSIYSDWSQSETEIETGASIDLTITPTISIKLPVAPTLGASDGNIIV